MHLMNVNIYYETYCTHDNQYKLQEANKEAPGCQQTCYKMSYIFKILKFLVEIKLAILSATF